MTDVWSKRAEGYRTAVEHREGDDLDVIVEWCVGLRTALDVATGGGHAARRLREAGLEVVTSDPAPGMRPDVVCYAEELPFTDGGFDVVVTRIAAHHFTEVRAAVRELGRVARRLVIIEDTLFGGEAVEEAERLRDPTHVRSYTEEEWRTFLHDAGLKVEEVRLVDKVHPIDAWLARTGCSGTDAERIRALLAERTTPDGRAWTDTKILLKAPRSRTDGNHRRP